MLNPEFSGSKGANLAQLIRAGFNVPPFFILSSSLYEHIIKIKGIDQIVKEAASEKSLENYRQIQSAILEAEIPDSIINQINCAFKNLIQNSTQKKVAIRSSALAEDLREHSFAGQLESYLNIQDEKQLLESIKKCWASLWNERVHNYISTIQATFRPQPMAVIVQQMVPSEYSGICFTIDPTDAEHEWMMIEADEGIGAKIVSGQINPFRYRIHRTSLEIKSDSAESTFMLFSGTKISELARACL